MPVTSSKNDTSNGTGTEGGEEVVVPDDGETVTPGGGEAGTDTPVTDPATPEKPGTDTPVTDPATPEEPGTDTTDPGTAGGETENGGGETPEQPEDPGVIVVPPEPTEPDPAGEAET